MARFGENFAENVILVALLSSCRKTKPFRPLRCTEIERMGINVTRKIVLFFAQGQKCVGKMVQIDFFAPGAPDGNLKRHKIHFYRPRMETSIWFN